MSYKGLFNLETPEDLFRKLEADRERMEKAPLDPYPAFDFFVTAHSMHDWLKEVEGRQVDRSTPLQRVVSHLANGSKHYEAKRNPAIDDARRNGGAFSSGFSSGFDVDAFVIELSGQEAANLGATVYLSKIADEVLTYWKGELGL
jgi:hypothetical protein